MSVACSRLSDSVENAKVKGMRPSSPQFRPVLFSFSRFLNPRGPDYWCLEQAKTGGKNDLSTPASFPDLYGTLGMRLCPQESFYCTRI